VIVSFVEGGFRMKYVDASKEHRCLSGRVVRQHKTFFQVTSWEAFEKALGTSEKTARNASLSRISFKEARKYLVGEGGVVTGFAKREDIFGKPHVKIQVNDGVSVFSLIEDGRCSSLEPL
jgi:hypothetical protein